MPIHEVDFDAMGKFAVVFGNEENGITEEMRSLCDKKVGPTRLRVFHREGFRCSRLSRKEFGPMCARGDCRRSFWPISQGRLPWPLAWVLNLLASALLSPGLPSDAGLRAVLQPLGELRGHAEPPVRCRGPEAG